MCVGMQALGVPAPTNEYQTSDDRSMSDIGMSFFTLNYEMRFEPRLNAGRAGIFLIRFARDDDENVEAYPEDLLKHFHQVARPNVLFDTGRQPKRGKKSQSSHFVIQGFLNILPRPLLRRG